MKTLVSRLSVWHATIGQENTAPEWGRAQGLVGALSPAQPSPSLSYQLLTSPAWMVHSRGRADGVRVGCMSWSQDSVVLLG